MNYAVQIVIQLIIAFGTILAAHITIKGTVKQELLRLRFAKAEKLSEDFSAMCSDVTDSLRSQNKNLARRSVSALLGRFDGDLANTLDQLLASLNVHDPIRTEKLLNQAVKEYRALVFGSPKTKTSIFRRSSK